MQLFNENDEGAVETLRDILLNGGVAAVPTETVYGLVCAWDNADAREKIYSLKRRPHEKRLQMLAPDVATAVKNAKAGQVRFRVDKAGIVHGTIGRRSFDVDKLKGNLAALIEALNKAKPATSKGLYLRKVAVSSTMGVGVRVDTQTIGA